MKREGCSHQWRGELICQPAFRNTYECSCGETWTDEWSCACDDECPSCGAVVSPSKSVEVAQCACEYLED